MASRADGEERREEALLVARVTVHLQTGESFELLPFFDDTDVKRKVLDLIGDWAKSGYLLKGALIYPWHQVKLIEVTSVIEISRSASEEQAFGENALEVSRQQQGFWKTKNAGKKIGDGDHAEHK